MKIAIAGAGAMGCRFGYMLTKTGQEVTLIDEWPAHIEAIQKNGLKVVDGDNTDTIDIKIIRPEEATEEVDVVIAFTKSMKLGEMLEKIKAIIHEDTKVLCLLNGLGHEDTMAKYVPRKNIIMGVTIWTAGLIEPGVARLGGTGTVEMQAADPSGVAIAKELVEVMDKAGLNASYSEDVRFSTWRKACVNGTMNATCAILDANIGEVFDTLTAEAIVTQIISEFVAVAEKEGVHLDPAAMKDYVYTASNKVRGHYPSMHQDLIQNHRYTEVDFLNGFVARKGKEYGIPTPYCQLITELIHAKEDILKVK